MLFVTKWIEDAHIHITEYYSALSKKENSHVQWYHLNKYGERYAKQNK